MKLIVPYIGELQPLDSRMIRLAEFLGIEHEFLPLPKLSEHHAEYLERAISDWRSCFVVNPRVLTEWVGGDALPNDLVACLLSRFQYLIVYGLGQNASSLNIAAALSRGQVRSIRAVGSASSVYEIAKDSQDICGAYAGISFGPTNPRNDHVLSCGANSTLRKLISIDDGTFLTVLENGAAEIVFLAGEDIADLDTEVGDAPVAEYFSRFVPHVMALRHIFAQECWRPCQSYATFIMDDPLLQRNYGHLNFESLLRLMKQHNFHTTVAFIPRNFRRSSPRITKMFRENVSRFSLCFHGNDHTGAEFASSDTALLNTMLHLAERRMKVHHELTGLDCDRVMVFPQGNFSMEAMQVLKSRNFRAAVNTVPHPKNYAVRLTIGDLAQPAVLRYDGFPLFLRKTIQRAKSPDIAFDLFFGKPILIVAHHDVFQRPESLAEVASTVNMLAPEIHWTNVATAVGNSILMRQAPDGTRHVRSYSGTVQVTNISDKAERFSVEWNRIETHLPVEQILHNGTPFSSFEIDNREIRALVELAPGESQTFSVVYRNDRTAAGSLGLRWNAKAFLRRRLSEVRDNYLSKNPLMLSAARNLQRRVLH